MIDTICLLIERHKVASIGGMSNQNWNTQLHTNQGKRFVKNLDKEKLDSGLYYPKVTMFQGRFGMSANLKIEFSVPKLLYGNNLLEVENKDYETVVNILLSRLEDMELKTTHQTIYEAEVCTIHYSKNIFLKNGYTTSQIIGELNKTSVRKSFDVSRVRYMNGGESLYTHTTSHEFVIYDKVADLKKPVKRAIDKDVTISQKHLLTKLENIEILRLEVRLIKKQKLREILSKLGYEIPLTFSGLFSEEISKSVVTYYWKNITKDVNAGVLSVSKTPKEILRTIYQKYPNIKPNKAIYLTGLLILAKDGDGITELRSIVDKKTDKRTWFRLTKDLKDAMGSVFAGATRQWVKDIDETLENYKSINKI